MKTQLFLPLAATVLALLSPTVLIAQNISPAAGPTPNPNQSMPDGFIMVGGKTYLVHRGVARPLEQEMVLRVTPSGVIGFDGLPRIISGNAMMTVNGGVAAVPRGLVFAPATQVLPAIDPRLQDRGIYGQNVSGLAPSPTPVRTSVGPRNIIAKKKTVMKSTKSSSPVVAEKRSTPKLRAPAPAFSDEVIPLPNRSFNADGAVSGTIDAETTMLNMTTIAPEPIAAPEIPSISASLGIGVHPGDDFSTSNSAKSTTVLPPNLVPMPNLTFPIEAPFSLRPAP